MPSGSSHSHSTPSRMRTSTLSSVLCSPDVGSGSRPACSSASAWNASNHASTSPASSSVACRSRPSGAGGTSTDVASHRRVALSVTTSPPTSSAVDRARTAAPGRAPLAPPRTSPRSWRAAASARAAGSGSGIEKDGWGLNGAVLITALTTSPDPSRTTTHHRSKGASTSAHESRPSASSRAVRWLTLAMTLPSTGSAASSSPAASRKGCGVSKNSSVWSASMAAR